MSDYKVIVADETDDDIVTGRRVAVFPHFLPDETSLRTMHKHVRLSNGGNLVVLCSAVARTGSGDFVTISATVAKLLEADDGTTVSVENASGRARYWWAIWHVPADTVAFFGLLVALVGLAIDAALTVGKVKVYFPTEEGTVVVLTFVSFGIKLLGLLAVYIGSRMSK